MLTVPTLENLATFTGRNIATFASFANQALTQATLLFSIRAGLSDYPTEPDKHQLAINGILDLADRLYLEQPFAQLKATPFNAETIGSYSYSKGTPTAVKAAKGQTTGLLWWDMAIEELSQVSRSLVAFSSIQVLDHDIRRELTTGRSVIVGPEDLYPSEFLPPGNFVEDVPTQTDGI